MLSLCQLNNGRAEESTVTEYMLRASPAFTLSLKITKSVRFAKEFDKQTIRPVI